MLDSKTLPTFLHGHQAAFRQFGGLPAVHRPDCVGTAIQRWQGEQSVLNPRYHRYLQQIDLAVFPSRLSTPTDKGKIKKRIQDLFRSVDLTHRVFPSLTALQALIDVILARLKQRWRCGATGLTIAESFAYEQPTLRPLPVHFPVLPLAEARHVVRRDGIVAFQGNYYQVPDVYREKTIACLHTGQEICCDHQGTLMARFPHLPGTKGMVRLHPEALQTTPIPLSDTVRAWALEVAERQVAIYQDLVHWRTP